MDIQLLGRQILVINNSDFLKLVLKYDWINENITDFDML